MSFYDILLAKSLGGSGGGGGGSDSGKITPSDMKSGYKLNPDGSEAEQSGAVVSNPITIPSDATRFIIYSYRSTTQPKLRVGFYDSNDNPTATGLPQVSTDTDIATIPNGSSTLKVCVFAYENDDVLYVFARSNDANPQELLNVLIGE